MNETKIEMGKKIYFCGGKRCCPSIPFGKGRAVIGDDRGHELYLTAEELRNLKELIDSAEKKGMP